MSSHFTIPSPFCFFILIFHSSFFFLILGPIYQPIFTLIDLLYTIYLPFYLCIYLLSLYLSLFKSRSLYLLSPPGPNAKPSSSRRSYFQDVPHSSCASGLSNHNDVILSLIPPLLLISCSSTPNNAE